MSSIPHPDPAWPSALVELTQETTDPVPAMRVRRSRFGARSGDRMFAYALLLPSLVILLALNTFPVFTTLYRSLQDVNTISFEATWIGLANFRELLSSELFWDSLVRTLIWTIPSVAIQLALGLFITAILNRGLKGQWMARGLVLFPYLVPAIVAGLMWRAMFSSDIGIVNYLLADVLGVTDRQIAWFADPSKAMLAVIIVGVWKFTPFMVILFLARLQTTPLELYEAAQMDGAKPWHEFRYVTLPWLAPTIMVALLLRTLFLFNEFDMIYLLTFGGPRNATMTLPLMIRNTAIEFFQFGLAAAISVLMLGVLVAFTVFYVRYYSRAEARIRQ